MNLIDAWFHVEREVNGKSIAQALRDLNEATGLKARINKVYGWRDNSARAPDAATYHMRIVVMRHAFFLANININYLSERQILTMADVLSPPLREEYKNLI